MIPILSSILARQRVLPLIVLSSLIILVVLRGGHSHEVQPSVADLTLDRDQLVIELDWVIEAPVAGIDLEGVADTNDAEGAEEYDRLRALEPEDLEAALMAAWDRIQDQITATVDGTPLELSIDAVRVPEVGDVELPRISDITLSAPLPRNGELIFGWDGALGPVVVRQMGVENGYTAFLIGGTLSDPISR